MSIANLTDYQDRRDGNAQRVNLSKSQTLTTIGKPSSSWLSSGSPVAGAAPGAAAVPTSATTGALGQLNSSSTQRILRAILSWGAPLGMVQIADRLSHTGGLDATVTTVQTTNLPTAALTRRTTGVGVLAALETYTAIGTTATTVVVSYTNTVPTAGQLTPAATFGGAGNGTVVGQLVPLALAAGDNGVTAVASVDLLASTVSAAGNFGVTLFYPLVTLPFHSNSAMDLDVEALLGMGSWFPIIENDACLFFVFFTANNAGTGLLQGELKIGED